MFPYILLAHFMADYPLQTDWVVRNKRRVEVLLLHIATHLTVMLIIVGQARAKIWPYLAALAGIHLGIDVLKNWVNIRWPKWVVLPYVVDQSFHWLTIALTSAWIGRAYPQLGMPFPRELAIYAIGYLVVTYVWFISERILVHSQPEYRREVIEQLWLRMVARAGWLSILLLLWGAAEIQVPVAALVIPLPYSSGMYRWRALFTDISVALGVLVFIQTALVWF